MGNIHEQIERFASQSPRFKTVAAVAVLAVIAGVLAFTFWLGVRSGDGWAESRYLQERDERMKKIERLLESERQLGAENAFLRKENEAQAEILRANDARLALDAKKLDELRELRDEQIRTIDLDNNFDSQLCGLCSDYERAGFRLSDAVCGRCKAAP